MNDEKVLFTKEMKKDYTILIPTMLPMHLKFIETIYNYYGYKTELLTTSGKEIADTGIKYVHNDTCYPAILVIGQFIHALQSGKYDVNKTALLLTQTGGGCRASNYISLLRKALKKAGLGQVPVISFNLSGLEKHPGFKISLPILWRLAYGVFYADLLMLLKNQCKPYEIIAGESEKKAELWTERLCREMTSSKFISYKKVKQNYVDIIKDFDTIKKTGEEKIKVGVVGEIFVKYSPLGNNNLEDFLISEGAEVVVPGLIDFCLYCVYNSIVDTKFYGVKKFSAFIYKFAYKFITNKVKDIRNAITENSNFTPPGDFDHTRTLTKGILSLGVKMGEGWLLCAEMLELSEMGINNIVCTQPFGCLPNHIAGKGMMKPIKEHNPDVNIVAIDYDPGASRINQENRIKLMLSNARYMKESKEESKQEKTKDKVTI
ncbi:MAG: 2-hydroxyglutaryl-CoA dehydratase [Acutalibacteraceae bacterium]